MPEAILTLNAGSSSLKFALFQLGAERTLALKGVIEGVGVDPHLIVWNAAGETMTERRWPSGAHEDFLDGLLRWIDDHLGEERLIAVGHRVVHGGAAFGAPIRIDAETLEALDRLSPLAPLHQPHNLAAIRAVAAVRPALPQIACFDTSFHHGQDPVVTRFALPRALAEQGVRRYGFHGLSYEYVSQRLRALDPDLAAGKVIVAHLGNGASLCGVRDGRSVDSSMGFTALDGLVMGTRCGTLDPGVTLHLLQQLKMTPEALEDLLYRKSGLLGLSGISSDMRVLLASEDPRAAEAIASFTHRIIRESGAIASVMGGLDGFVFTAGVGENAPAIRQAVCHGLGWLGLTLDGAANAAESKEPRRVDAADSRIAVWVVPTDEEAMIVEHTAALVRR
ncbi:MAG: acetate/propionate family kinase [Elsteraceae bacterium]